MISGNNFTEEKNCELMDFLLKRSKVSCYHLLEVLKNIGFSKENYNKYLDQLIDLSVRKSYEVKIIHRNLLSMKILVFKFDIEEINPYKEKLWQYILYLDNGRENMSNMQNYKHCFKISNVLENICTCSKDKVFSKEKIMKIKGMIEYINSLK